MALEQMADLTASAHEGRSTYFKCFACPDEFKREDHLRRHELSHGFPQLLCPHSGCGMRFHRNDVLKRHKTVHQAHPLKRRRRPRRGSLPRGKIQSRSPTTSPSTAVDVDSQLFTATLDPPLDSREDPSLQHQRLDAKPDWQFHCGEGSRASECSSDSGISLNDRDFDLQIQSARHALQSCALQYRSLYLSRMPFIHHTTLDDPCLPTALLVAMAAIGGRRTEQYSAYALEFFREALLLREQFSFKDDLQKLQCQMLLIEFAMWSDDDQLCIWAQSELESAVDAAVALNKSRISPIISKEWMGWVFEEELRRTTFALYSLSLTAYTFLDFPLRLRAIELKLDLPCSEKLFKAHNASDWDVIRHEAEVLAQHSTHADFGCDFRTTLRTFNRKAEAYELCYEAAPIFGQHVLLCGIVETIMRIETLPTATQRPMRVQMAEALKNWRSRFYVPPKILWSRGGMGFASIENNALLSWAAIALNSADPSTRYQAVDLAMLAMERFTEADPWDLITRGPVMVGRASHYCTLSTARTMLSWLKSLRHLRTSNRLIDRDRRIFARMVDAFEKLPNPSGRSLVSMTLDDAFDQLVDVWSLLFTNHRWAEGIA